MTIKDITLVKDNLRLKLTDMFLEFGCLYEKCQNCKFYRMCKLLNEVSNEINLLQ